MAEESIFDRDQMAEESIFDGNQMAEESIFDRDQMAEESIFDGDQMAEETIFDIDQMAEESIFDGDQMAEESIFDGDQMAEESIFDGDQMAEESIFDGDQMAEESIFDGDQMAEESIFDIDQMAEQSIIRLFCPKWLKELKSTYERVGLEATAYLIKKLLQQLDTTELNIAVTGDSGAGKSTFINTMRGLWGNDEGAAETGTTETTKEPAPYPHPNLPNVYFWNLPGIGTMKFPANKYLTEIKFKRYDFFIIISQSRFTENDAKLAKEIKQQGKNFYFVRSKIDNDLNSLKMEGVNINTDEELGKIREYSVSKLKEAGILTPTVFLISNFKMNEFDFPKLKETLTNNLDDIKKQVFLLSLPNTTLEIVESKRKELEKRISMLVKFSGAVGAMPVPDLSFACDIGILIKAFKDFRQCLSLDDASLQRLAIMAGKPVEVLKAEVKTPLEGEISVELVKKMLRGSTVVPISAVDFARNFIPVIGSLVGAGSSCHLTYKLLNKALNDLTENAQRVVKAAFGTDENGRHQTSAH
ncbi:interferon-inducible GTPase 5-like [Heptranchias perlo]|uniref:interferon-inducible GTPase 5-like n=1 Tax=Heptranchias perlo TaxID=212740 RepID=UPI0035595CEB